MNHLSSKKACPNSKCKTPLHYYIQDLPVVNSFYQATCPHCSNTYQFLVQWEAVNQVPLDAVEATPLMISY